ncbi:aldo/keto reductase, partial [bacterium]|nr:aldo/keto reductase [bacterium]
NQIPYNLIERGVEVEVLPQAVAEKIAITVYRPLVRGLLAGKYKPGEPPPEDSRVDTKGMTTWLERYGESIKRLLSFAKGKGISPAQVAISWLRKSPAVTTPIVGVSSLEQFKMSIKAFDFDLSNEEYDDVTKMFDTEVKEEAGGDYKNLRRNLFLLAGIT